MHHYPTLFDLEGARVATVMFIENKQRFDEVSIWPPCWNAEISWGAWFNHSVDTLSRWFLYLMMSPPIDKAQASFQTNMLIADGGLL